MSTSTLELFLNILEEVPVTLSKFLQLQLFPPTLALLVSGSLSWSKVAVHLPVCFPLVLRSIRTVACDSFFVGQS